MHNIYMKLVIGIFNLVKSWFLELRGNLMQREDKTILRIWKGNIQMES